MFNTEINDYALSDCAWWDVPISKRPSWIKRDCGGRVGIVALLSDDTPVVLCERHYNHQTRETP